MVTKRFCFNGLQTFDKMSTTRKETGINSKSQQLVHELHKPIIRKLKKK